MTHERQLPQMHALSSCSGDVARALLRISMSPETSSPPTMRISTFHHKSVTSLDFLASSVGIMRLMAVNFMRELTLLALSFVA